MNRSAAASLTVLFAALAAAQEAAPAPTDPKTPQTLQAAWQEALTLARTHKAPVLAFVLPPAGETADPARSKATRSRELQVGLLNRKADDVPPIETSRDLLLRQVQLLRVGDRRAARSLPPGTEAQAIFAMTVPVFASAANCGAKPGQTVVLLGPDGKRGKAFELDLLDDEAFVRAVGIEVLGPDALAARNANVAPELLDLLAERRALRRASGDARCLRASPGRYPASLRHSCAARKACSCSTRISNRSSSKTRRSAARRRSCRTIRAPRAAWAAYRRTSQPY
jgi:hypothetical protein